MNGGIFDCAQKGLKVLCEAGMIETQCSRDLIGVCAGAIVEGENFEILGGEGVYDAEGNVGGGIGLEAVQNDSNWWG